MTPEAYRSLVSTVLLDSLAPGRAHRRAFRSRSTEQAAAVAYALTTFTFGGLSVYASEASAEVWHPDLLRAHALQARDPVRILVDDPRSLASPTSALPSLVDLVRDGLILVRATTPSDNGRFPHVAIADDRHVRVERDKDDRGATTVFGDRAVAGAALQVFDTIWARAKPLAPGSGTITA